MSCQNIVGLCVDGMLSCGFAQTGGDVYVEGRVSNSEGKALLNVTCKLLDKRDSLLAYSFTDKTENTE